MSSPDESDGPEWAELEPNLREREETAAGLARQVRIQFAAGKSTGEVSDWLQQNGMSADQAKAFLAALADAERQANAGKLEIKSGPWDFGGVFAPRESSLAKRSERKAQREKSRKVAVSEPDPAFDLGGDCYTQAQVRDRQRAPAIPPYLWIAIACAIAAILSGLCLLVGIAFL
jgi:hypothetical protein